MGYTHYWNMQRVTAEDAAGYLRALPLIEELVERHKDILEAVEDNGNTLPIACEKEVLFNGIGEDAHETFVFRCPKVTDQNADFDDKRNQRQNGVNMSAATRGCKTARKPYDLPVCLVLLTLAAHMPNLELASDGFCGMLEECQNKPALDGCWEEAIAELKKYGVIYETKLTNERAPYCDLAPVLVSATERKERRKRRKQNETAEVAGDGADSNETVGCPLCSFRSPQLLTHLREAHSLTVADFRRQYPARPLFSAGFGDFALTHNLRVDSGVSVIDRDVLGVRITRPLRARQHVPHEDGNYYFDDKAPYVLRSLLDSDRILLVGHTGCGKSSLIEQLAARLNHPVRRFNLHGEVSASDFIGQWVMEEGKMLYRYGVLPTAMREGQILVLEELDAADPSVLFVLQGVLEDNGRLVIPDNGGEIIEPHKDFRLCATANTLGLGDDTGLYAGTRVLNASHLDRWGAVFELSYLPPELEAQMLCRKVSALPPQTAERLVNLANAVRKAASEEQLCCTFSTRRLLALASKSVSYNSAEKALAVTVLNKLSPADRAVVAELAQRIL